MRRGAAERGEENGGREGERRRIGTGTETGLTRGDGAVWNRSTGPELRRDCHMHWLPPKWYPICRVVRGYCLVVVYSFVCCFVSFFPSQTVIIMFCASGECSQSPQCSGRNAQLWRRPARPQSIGTRLGPQHDCGRWRSGQSESEHQSILELRQVGHGGLHSGGEPNDFCAV